MEETLFGRCLCGSVEFTLTPPTDFVAHCHCQSCRLSHGAPFVTWTSVPKDRFRYTKGEQDVSWYASSEWVEWGFCRHCGSSLLYRVTKEGHPESPHIDRMYVTVASLEGELDKTPTSHVSYEERVPWLNVADSLPKYRGKGTEKLST